MGRTPSVGLSTIHQIKGRIWDDASHKEIQEEFGVSYQMSVNIKAGRQYEYVPWPDGSTGGLSIVRAQQIADNKRYATRNGKSLGPAPTIPVVPAEIVHSLNKIAIEHGFSNIQEMEAHYKNEAELARIARINEEQRKRSEAYEESERIRMLPENVEARRLARANEPVERDDICDPDLQEMISEQELDECGETVVEVAKAEGDPALVLAIRICFKLFSQRQWKQDHVLKNIYSVAGKITKFWEENPLKDPRREYQMLDDLGE